MIEKIDIKKTIDDIKQDVINARNNIMYNANKELINLYFRTEKNISENEKDGTCFVETLSKTLRLEFPNSTGFSREKFT